MKVLAIDAGFRLGYGVLGGDTVLSGSHALPGSSKNLGLALYAMQQRLEHFVDVHKPDIIVIARPFISRKATPESLRPLFSMYGMVEYVAHARSMRCGEVAENTARKEFLGTDNLPSDSKRIKKAVIQACKDRGWPATDDHAADSLCVAAYALSRLQPAQSHETAPLFESSKRRAVAR